MPDLQTVDLKQQMSLIASQAVLCMLEAKGHPGWKGGNSFFNDIGQESESISTAGIGRYRTLLRPDFILLPRQLGEPYSGPRLP